MPSTLVALRSTSAPISTARSAAVVSVVKNGFPVPAREDDHASLLEVADGAPRDERLRDLLHRDRGLHPAVDAELLDGVAQRQRVDHRREHAHVVGGDPVDAVLGGFGAAHDVAAADDDRHLHAALDDVRQLLGDVAGGAVVDAVPGGAEQRLAAELEDDPSEDGPAPVARRVPRSRQAPRW